MTRYQAHPSEKAIARIRTDHGWDGRYGKRERRAKCRTCGITHGRIRYTHPVQHNPDEPSLAELGAGVLVLLVWFAAIFYALPILAEAVMR